MSDEHERAQLLAWFEKVGISGSMLMLMPDATTATLRSTKVEVERQHADYAAAGFVDESLLEEGASP